MDIYNKAFLAPISEYTNAPFRKMCKKYGADYTLVPLISATALSRNRSYVERIDFNEGVDDGIQLFGGNPADFSRAVDVLLESFPSLKWIDINCGCPALNVHEAGGGSVLLGKPEIISKILKEIRDKVDALTVKMRVLGKQEDTMKFVRCVVDAGADFITIHGRTPSQGYSGKCNWEVIKEIKQIVDVPIIGNGDIRNRKDGAGKVSAGYCDGFMIGRAAMGNPGCFSDKNISSCEDAISFMNEYIGICTEMNCVNINDLRGKGLQFFREFSGSSRMREEIGKCKSVEDIERILKRN